MAQVVYARVPDTVKAALETYRREQGLTLTGAVVDLIERGLTAATDEPSIATLERSLAEAAADRSRLEAELQSTRTELGALEVLAQRSGQVVGTCPTCQEAITGYDLLSVGRCSNCRKSLRPMLALGTKSTGLNQDEFLLLVGAIGALVGVAFLMSKTT